MLPQGICGCRASSLNPWGAKRGARSAPVLPPSLVAMHLGWGQPADDIAEPGRARVARAEMSSPGNSAINAEHRFFSTRKSHKAAQTCPEHAVVPEPELGRCVGEGGSASPSACLQDAAPQGGTLCLALPREPFPTQPGRGEMQETVLSHRFA